MLIGYARVSTADQTLASQEDDLRAAGCERIFTDVASGSKTARPGLTEALDHLRKGDTLVVWRLDRLGRSLAHLIETVGHLAKTHRGFRSLREQIDTTTPGGKLVFHLFGALAEFEREVIRERTKAGLSSARARGRTGGRPRRLDKKQAAMAAALLADRDGSVADICRTLGVSRSTLYRLNSGPRQNHPSALKMHPPDPSPPIQPEPQQPSPSKQPKGKLAPGTKDFSSSKRKTSR